MADEAHLFGSLDVARSNNGAAPSADDFIRGFSILVFCLRIYVLAHTGKSKQIAFQLCTRSYT